MAKGRRKPVGRARIGVAALATTLLGGGVALAGGASALTGHETNRDAVYPKGKPPTATTNAASNIKGASATLHGVVGPGTTAANTLAITSYAFQYGSTATYASQTAAGSVFSNASVSATIGGLRSCTNYHFRLVASSTTGTAEGSDEGFTTGFTNPITSVDSPRKAKRKHRFKVGVSLSSSASLSVVISRHGHAVKTLVAGVRRAGRFTAKISAPRKKGKYRVSFVAAESCGKQTVNKQLKVD